MVTTRADLLALLANPEGSGVEFKLDTVDSRGLAKELTAFANLRGGSVLLGVADDGTVAGLTRERVEEWVMTACRDKVRPELIPYFEIVRDVDGGGRDVAVVRVEPGYTVHSVWHNQHHTYYIRVGSVSREASGEELARLFAQRGDFRVELRPVTGTSLASLDLRRLRDYFERVRQQAVPDLDDDRAWSQLLVNTEMLADGEQRAATVAGLLLFGRDVNRFLPQAGIDAAAYPATEKDYATIERASLRGPLVLLDSAAGMVEPGVVEQALAFVRRTTPNGAVLEGGARRVDRPAYPSAVVREAVVNALVHRDYLLSGTDVELSVYADRLEIVSPGRLANGVTPARMRAGVRTARNQLVKDVLRDYGYLEHMGMGVPRTILRGMREHNGTEPDLLERDEEFVLRLWLRAGHRTDGSATV